MKGKTTNGLNYKLTGQVCTIEIPVTKSVFWCEYQLAQRELIELFSESDTYVKEFRCKKTGNPYDALN